MREALTIVAVGDLQLGDSPTTVGYGFYSRYRGATLDPLFGEVRSALAGADVVFANLETTLVPPERAETRRSALQLRGEPAFADALQRVGFTVVNVANNHAVQHGDHTFHATVASVRAAGIACCGVRGTSPWTSEPTLLLGGAVGFLGYSLRPRQYGSAVPPYAEGSRDGICEDVRRLRATGAVVVVSLHWGEEFVPVPSRDEIDLGHAIIDAGAALILGHHPHVTRPVERYAHGAIAYSLGNFMGDMTWYAPFRRGSILRCRVADDGASNVVVTASHLRDDYRPTLPAGSSERPVLAANLSGLDADSYAHAIAQTWRRQRIAAYWYALRRLPKTPLPILAQLAAQTVRNKLGALGTRVSRREKPAE